MFLRFKSNIKYIVFGLCPKGTTNLSPGFQPRGTRLNKRVALKGARFRRISPTHSAHRKEKRAIAETRLDTHWGGAKTRLKHRDITRYVYVL